MPIAGTLEEIGRGDPGALTCQMIHRYVAVIEAMAMLQYDFLRTDSDAFAEYISGQPLAP